MFTFVHGIFVVALFGGNKLGAGFNLWPYLWPAIQRFGLGFAVLSIASSHALSFVVNYIHGGEYRRASLAQLMTQPYTRVIVLHITILAGGFLMMALGSPVFGLVMLVAIKTGLDIRAHRNERRTLGEPRLPEAMEAESARIA
jgi:hypothetical protein